MRGLPSAQRCRSYEDRRRLHAKPRSNSHLYFSLLVLRADPRNFDGQPRIRLSLPAISPLFVALTLGLAGHLSFRLAFKKSARSRRSASFWSIVTILSLATMSAPEIPLKQKAAIYDQPGTVSTKIVDIDVPEPGAGEVLINLYVRFFWFLFTARIERFLTIGNQHALRGLPLRLWRDDQHGTHGEYAPNIGTY